MGDFLDNNVFKTILDPVGAILGVGIGKQSGGGGGGGSSPAPATLVTPETMPSLTSDASRQARRSSYAQQLARKGRASTILSNNDTLGPGG